MGNIHYGVLVGIPEQGVERGHHPHLYVKLDIGNQELYTVAINVLDYSENDECLHLRKI